MVGGNAQFGREPHPLPSAANGALLDSVHYRCVSAHFPLTVYEGYFREHKYRLLNQSFGPGWANRWCRSLSALCWEPSSWCRCLAVRRLGRVVGVGATLTIVFAAFVSLIAPVYIAPLFNKYTTVQDPQIRTRFSAWRALTNPGTNVYEFDASRQSNRVSANVSGFAGTLRVSLNDNLLKRCTLPEIQTTMGHEMGHYVLNHAYKGW